MENRPPFGQRFFPTLDYVFVGLLLCGGIFLYAMGDKRGELKALADKVKRELETVQSAVEKVGAPEGEVVFLDRYRPHLEGSNRLKRGEDALGHSFGDQISGKPARVPEKTVAALGEVVNEEFWEPFRVK